MDRLSFLKSLCAVPVVVASAFASIPQNPQLKERENPDLDEIDRRIKQGYLTQGDMELLVKILREL